MDYEYLGAYSIEPGEPDLVVTVKSAAKEEVKNADGKADTCLILYFTESEKGMVINATNAKRIEAMYKTGIVTEWVGKRIALYVEQVSAWGKTVPALRVREKIPATPERAKMEDKMKAVRAALSEAGKTPETIQISATLKEKGAAGTLTLQDLENALQTLKTIKA